MKGLLLKDTYMTVKYCRSYLLIVAIFAAISVLGTNTEPFSVFLCLIIGMLPLTLLAYDERSKWNEYCGALPYSKEQIVSSKYIFGILSLVIVVILMLIVQLAVTGFSFDGIAVKLAVSLAGFVFAYTSTALILPFVFWLGVEKGRIAYYILMCFVFAGVSVAYNIFEIDGEVFLNLLSNQCIPAFLGSMILYALSWLLSIQLYKRREVNAL